ncbi:MAG: hypothetical protein JXQ90_17290 [Cyclobacteriaceae bacterium]
MKNILPILLFIVISACSGGGSSEQKQEEPAVLTQEQEDAIADSIVSTVDASRQELRDVSSQALQEVDSLLETL